MLSPQITRYPLLKKLLISTGTSILIDTHPPCGCDELQLQQILSKSWCDASQIAQWMNDKCVQIKVFFTLKSTPHLSRNQPERLYSAFNGNNNGILLMKLRAILADACDDNQVTN